MRKDSSIRPLGRGLGICRQESGAHLKVWGFEKGSSSRKIVGRYVAVVKTRPPGSGEWDPVPQWAYETPRMQ